MANNEQNKIDATIQEGELTEQSKSGQSSPRTGWFILIVLIISVVSTGWLYSQQQQIVKQNLVALAAVDTENQQLTSQLQAAEQKIKFLLDAQQDVKVVLADVLAKQEYSSAELLAEWSLREIEFLLNVANQRAVLAKDSVGAKAALQMADKAIQDIGDYQLHPLRTIISDEMMKLDAVAKVDVAGMAIQLQTAVKHVDSLRVVKGPETSQTDIVQDQAGAQQNDWKTAASDIWQQVRSLVVIRHDDNGEAAVLVPEQRYFLYQNLKLQLESARLSLMNADSNGFSQSLSTAMDWLERYFVGDERDAMLTTLNTLQDKPIQIEMPDISASLQWIKEYQQ